MATTADAEVVMKLYDLRREEVLRKARHFVAFEFQPKTLEEFRAVTGTPGTQENAYWRQVMSYWEMAASLVLRGAVDADLFLDSQGEGIFLYAKFREFHAPVEQATGMKFMRQTAAVVEQFPAAQAVYERILKMLEARKG